jgi:hypothetical protein
MRDKDLYAQILGIKSPWQVSSVELALSEGEVTVHVEHEKNARWPPWRAKRGRLSPVGCEAAPYTHHARAPEGI